MIDLTVPEIRRKLQEADSAAFAVLERSLVADTRKGVRTAVEVARRRLEAEAAEAARLAGMYAFERELAAERGGSVVIGLDEVGRGPLAGPLAVGGVVLNADDPIAGLNDSKQVRPEDREAIAEEVRREVLAAYVGTEDDVLLETPLSGTLFTGYTRLYIPVVVSAPGHESGQIVHVTLGEYDGERVRAALC